MSALQNAKDALALVDKGEYVGSVAALALLASLVKEVETLKAKGHVSVNDPPATPFF